MSLGVTASAQVVRIAGVARRTEAESVLTNGSRAALELRAFADTSSVRAREITWTGRQGTAGASRRVRTRANFNECTGSEWIAQKALFATAVVASDCVYAHRVTSTRVSIALVDI